MSRKCAASSTRKYGEKALYDGGLQVRASLDTRLQNYAVSALRTGLVRYDRRHGWRGAKTAYRRHRRLEGSAGQARIRCPITVGHRHLALAVALGYDGKNIAHRLRRRRDGRRSRMTATNGRGRELKDADVGRRADKAAAGRQARRRFLCRSRQGKPGDYGLRQVPEVNGAIVAMDPHTGRVLALSGGFSYASSQFDRAMQAHAPARFVLQALRLCRGARQWLHARQQGAGCALRDGHGPGPGHLAAGEFREGNSSGDTTLRRGIELSRNVMTVRLAYTIGHGQGRALSDPLRRL